MPPYDGAPNSLQGVMRPAKRWLPLGYVPLVLGGVPKESPSSRPGFAGASVTRTRVPSR